MNYLRTPQFYTSLIALAAMWGTLYLIGLGLAAFLNTHP